MKRNKPEPVLRVIIGILVGLGAILLISIIGGIGISSGWLSENLTTAAAWTAVAVGSILSAVITGFWLKENKLVWTLLSGAAIFLILLVVHCIAFRGQAYSIAGSAAATLLPAAAIAIFVTQRRPKRKYR